MPQLDGIRAGVPHRAQSPPAAPGPVPRGEVLRRARAGRRLERLPRRRHRRVRRRHGHRAAVRSHRRLRRARRRGPDRRRVRHRRCQPREARRRGDHPGAAAPRAVAGAGARRRTRRRPGARPAARAAPGRAGRGGLGPPLQLRRSDPPPVHARRHRRRRARGGRLVSAVVCLDLDRTTIYSAAALDLRGPDHEAPRLLCVKVYKGAPLSFLTEAAAGTLRELQDVASVVPTTTRTPAQLARVHLPGPPARYAIASNGGHLLVDGVADPEWDAAVRERLTGCAPLAEVHAHLRARGGPFVLTLREASDLFAYAVVDRSALPDGWVDDLAAWCAPRG